MQAQRRPAFVLAVAPRPPPPARLLTLMPVNCCSIAIMHVTMSMGEYVVVNMVRHESRRRMFPALAEASWMSLNSAPERRRIAGCAILGFAQVESLYMTLCMGRSTLGSGDSADTDAGTHKAPPSTPRPAPSPLRCTCVDFVAAAQLAQHVAPALEVAAVEERRTTKRCVWVTT